MLHLEVVETPQNITRGPYLPGRRSFVRFVADQPELEAMTDALGRPFIAEDFNVDLSPIAVMYIRDQFCGALTDARETGEPQAVEVENDWFMLPLGRAAFYLAADNEIARKLPDERKPDRLYEPALLALVVEGVRLASCRYKSDDDAQAQFDVFNREQPGSNPGDLANIMLNRAREFDFGAEFEGIRKWYYGGGSSRTPDGLLSKDQDWYDNLNTLATAASWDRYPGAASAEH